MFTSFTASREFALKASDAAERAIERHICCKSQFKFKCFSCGEMINRGDNITKCTTSVNDGMTLRFRGAGSRNGLKDDEVSFYLATTGTRSWVHIGCNPCYWDSLPEDSNEYSPPALRGVYTDWGSKISYEFDEWRQLTNHYDMEEFLEKHGYPQDKWMKDRIIHSVTRFQAIWRGYLYKKAYPYALNQKRDEEAKNYSEFLEWCASLPMDVFRSFPLFCQMNGAATRFQSIWRGYNHKIKKASQSRPPHNHYARIIANMECWNNTLTSEAHLGIKKGYHFEFIFDIGTSKEAVYSGVVTNLGRLGGYDGVVSVRFHDDDEVRHYHNRRFFYLENQCIEFKKRKGIEGRIIGKLKTVRTSRYSQNSGKVSTEDWRYHYPDGNPVE